VIILLKWEKGDIIPQMSEPIRIRVNWHGLKLKDARVYAVYIEAVETG